MDDIDAAVEDAEYVRAMRDGTPQPVKRWDWMSSADLDRYIDKQKAVDPDSVSLTRIVGDSLGFYLFIKYVKENGKDNGCVAACDFMTTIAYLRGLSGVELGQCAKAVSQAFLIDSACAHAMEVPSVLGLRRSASSNSSPAQAADYRDGGSNRIRVSGNYITKVLALFGDRRNSNKAIKSPNTSAGNLAALATAEPLKISTTLFDPIEAVVFERLNQLHYEGFARSPDWYRYHQFKAMLAQMQTFGLKENDDFFTLRVVGRGGFGLVNACKKATTGKLYALKQMSKRRVKLKHCEELIVAERDILAAVHSPYVVNLIYAFTSADDVFLVLDLMMGGDLSFHLKTRGRFSLKETKYFVARTVLALAALHDLNFAHRDLKPENILLDVQGRCRISDFGLAGQIPPEGLTKLCGTRGYWAPEMVARPRRPYFLAVDWFSLGVCMYELLTGANPFHALAEQALSVSPEWDRSQYEAAIDKAIVESDPDLLLITAASSDEQPPPSGSRHHSNASLRSLGSNQSRRRSLEQVGAELTPVALQEEPSPKTGRSFTSLAMAVSPTSFSRRMSTGRGSSGPVSAQTSALQARDLVRRLLCKDPMQRIGWAGYRDIMQHEWFADISWGTLSTVPPPWCPEYEINMKAQSEIGEFADEREAGRVVLTAQDQAYYKDWNFVSEKCFQDEIVEFLLYEEIKGPIRPAAESSCCTVS